MYEGIKSFIKRYPYSVPIVLAIVFLSLVWVYSDRSSNIDTTGIRNAEQQLERAGECNQQSIDYNQRVGTAVENSQTINERAEERINTSIDLNTGTENAINTSTELVARAREEAIRAKTIVSESRSILERAEKRNQKSEITTKK